MEGKIARRAAPKKTPRAAAKKAPRARAEKAGAAPPRYEPGRLVVCEDSLSESVAALQALDPETIGLLLDIGGPPPLRRREPGFAGLAAIIVSQQVSVASAAAIFGRLEARLNPLTAAAALAAGEIPLKECGLSGPKIRAILSAARAVVEEGLDLTGLAALPAADAHRQLVTVKGVGPWTADIFLLFCLGHPDAFPAGDLALQEAAKLALGLRARPDAAALEKRAERWRPFRGVAARMLWVYYAMAKARAGVLDPGLAKLPSTR
jgi:DNA-3-methyladenine glycosylase II